MEVAHPQSDSSSTWFLVKLEFENVGFWGEGKTGVPGYQEKNLSEQKREPATNSTNICHWHQDMNLGHISWRPALSPLCYPLPLKGCQPPTSSILGIDREGMIDDVIMHGTWCLLCKTRDLGTRLMITNLWSHKMRENNVVGFVTFDLIDLLPNDPIIKLLWKNSSHVSGLSICIFVALWLCLFGFVLQVPIRLKVLWVDAKNQWDFGI